MKKIIILIILISSYTYGEESSLTKLLSLAEANNRELVSLKFEIESRKEMAWTAYMIPKTMIGAEKMNNNIKKGNKGEPASMMETRIFLSQEIPFPTTFSYNSDVKSSDITIAKLVYDRKLLEIRRDVALMYNELVYMKNRISIMEQKLGQLNTLTAISKSKMGTGMISIDEFIKIKVMASMTAKEIIAMKGDYSQAENKLLGMINIDRLPDGIEYHYSTATADISNAENLSVENNPDILILKSQSEKFARERSKALAGIAPDLRVEFSLNFPDNGEVNYNIATGVSLPLFFSFNEKAEADSAGKMKASADEMISAKRRELKSEVSNALIKLTSSSEVKKLVNDSIIAEIKTALDLSVKNYSIDKAEIMDVVNTMISLYDYRMEIEKADYDIATGSIMLKYLTGGR